MKKISHSAWKKYHTCPRMYKLHYVDRLRSNGSTSALVFGTAIDVALNELLVNKKDPLETFRDNFTWEHCKDISFFPADLDEDLFDDEQTKQLTGKSIEYASWASLRIKGRLMLKKYMEVVYPTITEVHYVQLETDRPGSVDAVVSLRGHGMVFVDHKTSSKPYERDSVKSSSQLALYAGQIGLSRAGFIVLSKQINKNKVKTCKKCSYVNTTTSHQTCNNIVNGTRCGGTWNIQVNPEASVQVIIDSIDTAEQKVVEQSVVDTENAIKTGVFPMNVSACHNMFGKKCQYFDYCRHGKTNGLEVIPEREKDKK